MVAGASRDSIGSDTRNGHTMGVYPRVNAKVCGVGSSALAPAPQRTRGPQTEGTIPTFPLGVYYLIDRRLRHRLLGILAGL